MKEEKKKALEKVGNYAKYVKEMYWPKINEKKRMELIAIKEGLRTPMHKSSMIRLHIKKDEKYEDSVVRMLSREGSMPNLK